jgi:hypothetical protein
MTEPAAPQNQPEPTAPEAQPEQNVEQLPPWAREAITKANREAANYRTQVNELKPLADQFRQLDEASKSEMQRLQEERDAAARDRDNNAAAALRYQVAIEHGIGKEDLDLLGGGTQEEIAARAARIAQMRAAAAQPAPPTAPPTAHSVPDLRPGATPPASPTGDTVESRHARYFGARQNTPQ